MLTLANVGDSNVTLAYITNSYVAQRLLWLNANTAVVSHLLGSSELSVGCSDSVSTCSLSAVGRRRRRGPAGRYRDSEYRYKLAAKITEISPTSERILHPLLARRRLLHLLVVSEVSGEKQWPTVNSSSSSSMKFDGS